MNEKLKGRMIRITSDIVHCSLEEAEKRGYDTSELIWVDQSRNIAALSYSSN